MANRHFQFGKVSSSCCILCIILALLAVYVIMNRDKFFKSSFGAGDGVSQKVKITFVNNSNQGVYVTRITHGKREKTGLNEFKPKDWPEDVKINQGQTKTINPLVTKTKGAYEYVCIHGLPGGAYKTRIWVRGGGGILAGDVITYRGPKNITYARKDGRVLNKITDGKLLPDDRFEYVAFNGAKEAPVAPVKKAGCIIDEYNQTMYDWIVKYYWAFNFPGDNMAKYEGCPQRAFRAPMDVQKDNGDWVSYNTAEEAYNAVKIQI